MNNIDFDAIDLTKEAPVTEPERQYYYIAKARKYVSEKAQEIGRDLTFCVTTFGCQMNARDSEKLVGVLELIGYKEEPDEEKADFVWRAHRRRRSRATGRAPVRRHHPSCTPAS